MPNTTIDVAAAVARHTALARVLSRLTNCRYPAPGSYGLHSAGYVERPPKGYVGQHRAAAQAQAVPA